MEFKDRLKELRTEKGYTQKDIAEVLGFSKVLEVPQAFFLIVNKN